MGYDKEMSYGRIPPRYGIIMLNASECINSMIDEYRNEGWMELTDGLLHDMTTRISTNQQTYKMEPEDEVVPKVKDIL